MKRLIVCFVLLVGCATSEDRRAQDPGAAGGEPGGADAYVASVDDAGSAESGDGAMDAWPEAAPYNPSCEAEICSAEERCVQISAGSRCMHACAGQLACASGQSSWCTRQGGARCVGD